MFADVPFRRVLGVPLKSGDTVIGVIMVDGDKPGAFSEDDVRLVSLFADQAALAVEKTRLYEAIQHELAERKRAEEMLQQRNRELAALNTELQARNEELDAFAHTVAHDLQNPLAIITGLAEQVEESYATFPEEELQRYLQTISRNGRKMSNIIEGLLLLAGVRKAEVERQPLDMAGVVAEARQRLVDLARERQAEIILPPTWPVARGHAPWVEEVWVNYLSNAIKYGGRPPRVEAGRTGTSRWHSALLGARQWRRHCARDAGPVVHAVYAAQSGSRQRARPGAIHCPTHRGKARRTSRSGKPGGPGQHFFLHPAVKRGERRVKDSSQVAQTNQAAVGDFSLCLCNPRQVGYTCQRETSLSRLLLFHSLEKIQLAARIEHDVRSSHIRDLLLAGTH